MQVNLLPRGKAVTFFAHHYSASRDQRPACYIGGVESTCRPSLPNVLSLSPPYTAMCTCIYAVGTCGISDVDQRLIRAFKRSPQQSTNQGGIFLELSSHRHTYARVGVIMLAYNLMERADYQDYHIPLSFLSHHSKSISPSSCLPANSLN